MNSTDLLTVAVICILFFIYKKWDVIKELIFSNDDHISAVNSGSRDIVQVVLENNKNYLVLFGSQTGTAEDYAKKFSKELSSKFNLNVLCADLELYDYDTLSELPNNVLVSIFMSTYGEGDFPDGAIPFETFLTTTGENSLTNLNFSIFGLGNSTYEFYNGAARKVLKYLQSAGGNLLGSIGEGDDATGSTDEDYLTWKESIMAELKNKLHLEEQEHKFKSTFKYETLPEINSHVSLGEPTSKYLPSEPAFTGPFTAAQPFIAPIIKSHELFTSVERNCIHSEFDISSSNISYSTGDHLGIWPSNATEKVQQFLNVFNLNPDTIFNLVSQDKTIKVPFPCPTTVGAVIRHYLEITGPVSRQFFEHLIQFAPNSSIKEKLTKLAKDKDAFQQEITSKYFNLADALLYLSGGSKWESIPWEFLIENIPKLQPRYYSISSSSLSERNTIHVTSVVENTPNPKTGSNIVGVTTNLLRNIQLAQNKQLQSTEINPLPVHYDLNGPRDLFANYKLPVHVRQSTFRLPQNIETPVIMIGPGTGVAPFRGFIRERVAQVEKDNSIKLGKHILFYGCRNEQDYLYQEEWSKYATVLGESFEMNVAFSRVPGTKKVYVQDKLNEMSSDIWDLLKKGAYIYVCGDAGRMAKDVSRTFINILQKGHGINEAEALEMVKALKTAGKYQEDVW
ncbi:NADPH--cytochrome P450 reductase NDAI_0C03940 [Naumovozyma dairenensis CBS 421]|uniref:NADPH--cytochrome P450 reductase n=1 Tax=Naumovozyma dairenensis (strain ATCC 10597 / BCRC 20456 / CBS 421 / NBRC 0211 / NRRL Y-12639) TaxID=1071378 RepID=G0W8E3_NAUDC|nr:hypothetical protein NDAI_0C03940 [Naumovozyma dairenensis CBS 421]CCD24054.1 hypothetical protein NDAI_0C03940 [Naumovozyma dairenensis CBS 421]